MGNDIAIITVLSLKSIGGELSLTSNYEHKHPINAAASSFALSSSLLRVNHRLAVVATSLENNSGDTRIARMDVLRARDSVLFGQSG